MAFLFHEYPFRKLSPIRSKSNDIYLSGWNNTGRSFFSSGSRKKNRDKVFQKNEPGDIGTIGPYRGKPIPYGSADLALLTPNEDIQGDLTIDNPLIQTLIQHHATFRACGATTLYVYLAVGYEDQCNMAFDTKLMKALGECDIELWVSCYERKEEEDGGSLLIS